MNISRRTFLSSGVAAGVATAFTRRSSGSALNRRPNVVFVMADDMGYESLACNGATECKSPNLDRLAAQGVRFTSAHSTPLCTPTRVQVMTGKYGFRNYTEFGALKPGEYTFGHHFQKAGYKTCVVGKWQLQGSVPGTQQKGEGTKPDDAGFDEHCLWHVRTVGSRYWDPVIQVNNELKAPLTGKYGSDVFLNYAQGFIEKNRERPFFLYYPMVLTHNPFVPTPASPVITEEDKRKDDPKWFPDMVAYTDYVFGKLWASLEANGLTENTLVIFTGDNGTNKSVITQTVNGPVKGGKGGTTHTGTHVPMIAYWKGKSAKGKVCDDLIDFTDIFPTICEAAGLEMPAGHPRDGRTFLPQIRGEKGNPREWIFCHYNPKWGGRPNRRWVMDHRWKLYDNGDFHDLKNDPDEKHPVSPIPAEAVAVKRRFEAIHARMVVS